MIVCDNDMEIILKGTSEDAIRKMLDNRLFALVKMPVAKMHSSAYSSSVFVDDINLFDKALAIRAAGSKTFYEDCEYYLKVFNARGVDEKFKGCFERGLKRQEKDYRSVTTPTVDELIAFLSDKELFIITNYMAYGNFENVKVKDFLDRILLLRKECGSNYVQYDDFLDVRVYLTRADDAIDQDYRFHTADVRSFDIRQRTVDLLERLSKANVCDSEEYAALYSSAEFEAQTNENVKKRRRSGKPFCDSDDEGQEADRDISRSNDIQAAYFVTRFHTNLAWEADPVSIVTVRISAFILPDSVSRQMVKKLPADKKTKHLALGTEYKIDSIHVNSDIFYDVTELEDYLADYFGYMLFD